MQHVRCLQEAQSCAQLWFAAHGSVLVQVAVLLWGESQRDIEMCKEVLEQVLALLPPCAAEVLKGQGVGACACTHAI